MSINMDLPKIPKHLIKYRINPKAFINAHNFPTLNDLIDEVKRIDSNDSVYKAMLKEPVFLDDFNPFIKQKEELKEFLESIIEKGEKKSFRRGEGVWLNHYKIQMQKYGNLPHLMKYFKAAKVVDNILSKRTKIRDFIKQYKKK